MRNRIQFLVTDVWCYYIYVMSISKLHANHCILNGASIIGLSHMTIVMYANIFPSIDQHTYHATHTASMETSGWWVINLCASMANLENPTMHMSHIRQCTTQNRNVYISVMNGALWDMGQVHCGICELGQLSVIYIFNIVIVHVRSIESYPYLTGIAEAEQSNMNMIFIR